MPLPPQVLGQWRQGYASMQGAISRTSARLPLPALDLLIVAAAALVLWVVWARRGSIRPLPALAFVVLVAAAAWLLFLALWGWNYQVPSLETRLGVTHAQLTAARAADFARATIAQLNATHAGAHANGWPTRVDVPSVLARHLSRVLPVVGVSWTPMLPSPRRTMIDWYFRAAGIDGMTNPFGLEVLLNTRVLPMELPALAAHEYAHLAGFADESDASVVAWLVCQDGGPELRYSGALAVLPHVLSGLHADERRRLLGELAVGPRRDLQAIAARLAEQRPWVHAFAWQTYDRFLRANRVEEGVARYDAVARVLVAAADPATGRLLRSPTAWPPPRP